MLKIFGHTLIELMIVLVISGILLSAIFGIISSSRSSWDSGAGQIVRQQDARKGIDRIAWELRSTDTAWNVSSTLYNVSINAAGDQIDFYQPVFVNNSITELRAVRYYVGGQNNAQLLRKEGGDITVATNNIDNVVSQKPFFSFNSTPNIIDIRIPIIKDNIIFVLASQANLRNRGTQLDGAVVDIVDIEGGIVEEPEEEVTE